MAWTLNDSLSRTSALRNGAEGVARGHVTVCKPASRRLAADCGRQPGRAHSERLEIADPGSPIAAATSETRRVAQARSRARSAGAAPAAASSSPPSAPGLNLCARISAYNAGKRSERMQGRQQEWADTNCRHYLLRLRAGTNGHKLCLARKMGHPWPACRRRPSVSSIWDCTTSKLQNSRNLCQSRSRFCPRCRADARVLDACGARPLLVGLAQLTGPHAVRAQQLAV